MENEKKKEQKPAKAPRAFRKPLKAKTFERKYVKYIEHPKDRTFLTSCFNKQDDVYIIKDNLTRDDVKRLKGLIKVVKANHKGAVSFVPLAVISAVIAVVAVFFIIFANPLLERVTENALETIFEARADINNFRISLLRFSISAGDITVANRDSPMTNLFQMGRTEIHLKPAAVLRGKIYIEEIRADTIRFGTERTFSGSLPGKPPREKEVKEKSETPPLIDLKNFDAMALLNQEYEKLNTPKMYDEAINAYNESVARWQNQVASSKTKIEDLRTASAPILNLNTNSLRDPQAIRNTIQDINNMITSVQSASSEVTNIFSSIESEVNNARQLEQNARNALINDINHLKSYIDLGSGAAFAVLEPVLRDLLSDTAEEYLDYGIRALDALEKLKAMADAQPKTEKPVKEAKAKFKGRDVIFPVVAYPKFFLGILASDFTLDTWNWAFDLRDVSSNPDITNRPVTLKLGLSETGAQLQRQVDFAGSADFRTNPSERFNANLNASGFPVSLDKQLDNVGISGFAGNSAFSVSLAGQTSGAFSGGGDIKITQAMLKDPRGTLAEAIDLAVRDVNNVNLGFQYLHHIDRRDEFKLTTNITDLVTQAVRRIAEAYAKKAMDEIEKALRDRISQYIDGRFVSKEELDLLFRSARGDKDSVDQLRGALTSKREEFENRLKSAAEDTVQQAIQDNLPGLNTGGLRIPGR